MASDKAIKNRLLIQFDQVLYLETTQPQEVRCVEELISEGALIGSIKVDENGVRKASVDRLTKTGQYLREAMRGRMPISAVPSSIIGAVERVQIENDRQFDETLVKLSSAGLGLQLGFLPLFEKTVGKVDLWLYCCYSVSAVLCAVCAMALLVSLKTSSAAFSKLPKGDGVGTRRFSGITVALNWIAFGAFIVASMLITVFVCFISYKVMKIGG